MLNDFFGEQLHPWFKNLTLGTSAVIIGLVIKFIFTQIFRFFARFWAAFYIASILKHLSKAVGIFIPLLLLNSSIDWMELEPANKAYLNKIFEIALTINFSVILIQTIKVFEDFVVHKYDFNKENNLRERKIRTQLQFIRKFVVATIILLTIAVVLLSFESMRKVGTGLLTGVGIGGIIVGFAAQKSLGNLLAGFQIAFTQPIRIDDVVVVESQWGKVEEITLTYVVVNLWDQRRLVLPITYFIEKPFENWTRVSSQLLGTVFLYLDYSIPIVALREELTRLLTGTSLWDKRVNVVQLTDNKETSIEVRLLMSAKNSSNAFDLRCYIREQMILFIQKNYPESLPKTRVELNHPASPNFLNSDASGDTQK